MGDELESTNKSGLWKAIDIPNIIKPICYKWIFQTKRDSKANIMHYKARVVARDFTHRE